jgi:glucosamine--fructose-6-phosphate aminotransferase (isomerizing)
MTHFLDDILRQPSALAAAVEFLGGAGRSQLTAAAGALRRRSHIYLTGIGSSYHAALGVASLFQERAAPVYLQDAAELLHFAEFPPESAIVVISRSGQSVEVVNLLAKARASGAVVIGLTNSADGALAREAQIPIVVPTEFDHAISVNTYSTLAAAAAAMATATLGSFGARLQIELMDAIRRTGDSFPVWQEQIAESAWLKPGATHYFLARGASMATCYETRLLWEEGVKSPATAMGTGSFRHGPQEIVAEGVRFGLWIDAERMREEDVAVARDLRKLGASVMLIGSGLPKDAGDLVLQIPRAPAGWQFLLDIVPAQLTAERLARLSNVDCDTFRFCSYIVRGEYGLVTDEVAAEKNEG